MEVLFHIQYFSITGARNIVCYTEDLIIQRFVKSMLHCTMLIIIFRLKRRVQGNKYLPF